jgi:hypothetical protein
LSAEATYLRQEGETLFRAVFRVAPDDRLLTAYVAAHAACFAPSDGEELARFHAWCAPLLARTVDWEALEYAWRLRSRRNLLTAKIHILLYLAEISGRHESAFRATARSRPAGWLVLGVHGARSAVKLLVGLYLLRKHRV